MARSRKVSADLTVRPYDHMFESDEVPPVDSTVRFQIKMPAAIMGGTEDVLLDCVGRIVRHDFTAGRSRAAAVIDKYSLRADRHEQ